MDKSAMGMVSALNASKKRAWKSQRRQRYALSVDPSTLVQEVNMRSVIIPIGAGIILSVVGYIYNQRRIGDWMQSKRIDKLPERPKNVCGVCGSPMKERQVNNGEMAGKRVMVCTRWPECRKVEWNRVK